MKKILLLMALACPPVFAAAQSCTPDLSITQPGMYPDIATNLPYAYVGVPYSTSVQFKVLTDTTISGTPVTVTSVTLDSVAGMPAGFTWSSNPANHLFPGGSNACASLWGNPTSGMTGVHPLIVHLTVRGLAFGFIPVTQKETVNGYKIKIYGAPVVYFSGTPTDICEGESVTFEDNSSNFPTSWQWSFPGGTPSSSNQQIPPPVVYATSGNKNVTLTVSSPAGSDTKTKNSYVTVSVGPAAATVTPPGNVTLCSGSGLTLSANTGVGFTYQWLKNGVNISGANASTFHATVSGNYSVIISIASGCSKTSPATNLTVSNVAATITALGSTTFCDGENVVLKANSGTGFNYQWKKDGTNISGATNITYTASSDGDYKAMITDLAGCTDISTGIAVTVNNLPTATISANGPITFCKGDKVTLTANTGSGLTYQWTTANVPINGATNSAYIADKRGWFRAVVTNSNGCTKISNLIHVYVNYLPTVTVSENGPLSFCNGQSVTLTASSPTGVSYQWMKQNVDLPGATGISYNAGSQGSYKVRVTDSNGCEKLSDKKDVAVHYPPSANITANGPLTFCQGQSVTLTANSGIGFTYQWTKLGINIPGETGISYLAKKTGAYRVVVTNLNGCSKVSAKKNVLVNCREENENAVSSEEADVIIYPNPASSLTTIDLTLVKAGIVSIKVFDVTGKLVLNVAEGNFEDGKHQFTFDTSGLETGIYLATIVTDDGTKTIKLSVDRN
ncbi:MAG TPA: PKD domain-containing protein [Bacteroidia bacterium]|nr:PKD domain-containing protein [Bacteroidia bacterium]